MTRSISVDFASRQVVGPEALYSDELGYALMHALRPGTAERLRVTADGDALEYLELLYFPVTGRSGIAWRGVVWWLDATSPHDAVERWMEGGGRTSPRRDRARAVEELGSPDWLDLRQAS